MRALDRLLRQYGFDPDSGAKYLLAGGLLGLIGLVSMITYFATRAAYEQPTARGTPFGPGPHRSGAPPQTAPGGSGLEYIRPQEIPVGAAASLPAGGGPVREDPWAEVLEETVEYEESKPSRQPFAKPRMKTGKGYAAQTGQTTSGAAVSGAAPPQKKRDASRAPALGAYTAPRPPGVGGSSAASRPRLQAVERDRRPASQQAATETRQFSDADIAVYEHAGNEALEAGAEMAGIDLDQFKAALLSEGQGPTIGESDILPSGNPCTTFKNGECVNAGGGTSGTLGTRSK